MLQTQKGQLIENPSLTIPDGLKKLRQAQFKVCPFVLSSVASVTHATLQEKHNCNRAARTTASTIASIL